MTPTFSKISLHSTVGNLQQSLLLITQFVTITKFHPYRREIETDAESGRAKLFHSP